MNPFSLRQRIYFPFKRGLDILFSFVFILLLSPLYLVLFVIVLIDTKAFPLFRQLRFGKKDKKFIIYKFRSMKSDAPKDVPTHEFKNADVYTTAFGKTLRKSSLDELPQLWNIFTGKMSFVGPRPALYNQLDLIHLRQENQSNLFRPGLTGLAQVNGRDSLSVEEKAHLDGIYAKKVSFWLDLKIIMKTFFRVLSHKDIKEGEIK